MIELNDRKYTCPIDVTLGFVGGKWKILILSHLQQFGGRNYSDIKKNLPAISEKMLSQQLKELERDRLIIKTVLSGKPYRVEYNLSDHGRTLHPLFEFLTKWGIEFLKGHGIDYLKDQNIYK